MIPFRFRMSFVNRVLIEKGRAWRHRPRPWLAKLLGQEVDFLKIILHNGRY